MFKNNYLNFLIFLNCFCYVFGYYKYYDINSPCRHPILKTRGICTSEICNSTQELRYYYGVTPAQCYPSHEFCCIYPLSGSVKNVQEHRISAEECSSNRIHEDRNIYRPAQYLAHWRIIETGRPTINCAGALISPFFILTSAKCTVTKDRKSIGEIYLGGSRITDVVYPEQLLPYASYDNMTLYHDIGLIKLTEPVKYNFINGYPCLWQTDAIYSEKLTMYDIEYNRRSDLYYRHRRQPYTKFDGLKYKFTLFRNEPCTNFEVFSKYGHYMPNKYHMNEHKLCLENFKPETADCNTINSGTPITAKIWNTVYIVGVASEVECKDGHLMRHSRVSSYLNWIEHIVWNNGYVSRGYRE